MSENTRKQPTPQEQVLAQLGLTATLTVAEAQRAVELVLRAPLGIPVLVSGTSQGKTVMLSHLAETLGYDVVVINMIGLEPADLRGLPFPAPDRKSFVYLQDGRIPLDEDDRKVLLFLDEANRCPESALNAVFQLLNGLVGGRRLGRNVRIVMAVNPSGQGYAVASGLTRDPALLARCTFIPVQLSLYEALLHMRENRWHPWVVRTLEGAPAFLTEARHGDRVGATPRAWERVSGYLHAWEAAQRTSSSDARPDPRADAALRAIIEGTVGPLAAAHLFEVAAASDGHDISVEDLFRGLAADVPSAASVAARAWCSRHAAATQHAAATGEPDADADAGARSDNNMILLAKADGLAAYMVSQAVPPEDAARAVAAIWALLPRAVGDQVLLNLSAAVGSGGAQAEWHRAVRMAIMRSASVAAQGRDAISRGLAG